MDTSPTSAAATDCPPSSVPADCGRRLLPKVVDEIAASDPDRVYASIPTTDDVQCGWADVTYRTFAIAVSRCARWIEAGLGGKSDKDDVLLYMGPLDLRFAIVLLAALKTGRVAQFSSTRNSLEAHISLLENAGCKAILLPDDAPSVTSDILTQYDLAVLKAQSLEHLLEPSENDRDNEIYEWNADFDGLRLRPCVILHTSGTTGIPKPVLVTHGVFAANDAYQTIPSLGGRPTVFDKIMRGKRIFVGFPLFHGAALAVVLGLAAFYGVVPAIPPSVPLTAEVVDHAHTHAGVEGSLMPPSLIKDISNDPQMFENLIQNIQWTGYTGGPLSSDIGDNVAKHIQVIPVIGFTEALLVPTEAVDEMDDWQQVPVSPFFGHKYRPTADGLAELVIVRDPKFERFQGCFCTFPDRNEYSTRDLYTQHPSNPRYWSFAARNDDLILFSNGEKLNPITLESVMSSHPLINAALVGGHGQFQASLLIEPCDPYPAADTDKENFVNEIWPTVLKANRTTVGHGRIMKDHIFFTSPDRPLPRVPKGTVERSGALKMYAQDFRMLYKSRNESPFTQRWVQEPSAEESNLRGTEEATKESEQAFSKPSSSQRADGAIEPTAEALVTKLRSLSDEFNSTLLKLEALLKIAPQTAQSVTSEEHNKYDEAETTDSVSSAMSKSLSTSTFDSGLAASPTTSASSAPSADGSYNDNVKIDCDHAGARDRCEELSQLKGLLLKAVEENAVVFNLTETADLFSCGLDSLQTGVVVDSINKSLSSAPLTFARQIKRADVFKHPTIEQLASVITQY